ncbi:MAG TPA: hypothetical protein VK796_00900, partial [Cytophaga sp.]|nr:hypothetical protein [Cytophaga sp.]
INIEGNNIYWEFFDWDMFQKYKRIDIKEFSAQKFFVNASSEKTNKNSKSSQKDLPDIRVRKLNIDQLSVLSTIANDTLSFNAHQVVVDSLRTIKQFFAWKKLDGIYENIRIQKENLIATIQLLKFNALTEVVIQHVSVNKEENNTIIHIKIPAITILGNFYSTDFSALNIQKLDIQNPVITYLSVSNTIKKDSRKKAFIIPINIIAKELIVSNAQIHYKQMHVTDTLSASGQCSIKLKNIIASKANNKMFSFEGCILDLNQIHVTRNNLSIDVPTANIQLKNGFLKSARTTAISFESDLSMQWEGICFAKGLIKNNGIIKLENIFGNFIKNQFIYSTDKEIAWQGVLNNLNITSGAFNFSNEHSLVQVNEIKWQNKLNMLSLNDISYHPKLSLEDAIKNAPTQFDYLTLSGKSIQLKNINISDTTDSMIHIQYIILNQIELSSTRDKNVVKKIVKIKAMPTKIIQTIPWPITIDSLKINNSKVIVHQIEEKTYNAAMIPITNINATVANITNRTIAKDSLYLVAHANILDVAINSFRYTESYTDSLSYFHASSNIVPGKFTNLNALTVPLAALEIDNGYSNNLSAVWVGNKYAAIGQMNFIYKNLSVHILNKNDTSQTNLALKIENKLANEVINKNNNKASVIFFERNTEKQIFHYWLKATLQGVYSSVGLKSNDKYLKHYKNVKGKYYLP